MDKHKIIFANRKDCFEKRGGDTVQMIKTKELLEKLFPVDIKICLNAQEILEDNETQIVHIFNLETINETNELIEAAKKTGKKVVLSTIHWNFLDTYYVKYLEFIGLPPINMPKLIKILLIKTFNIFIMCIPQLRKKFDKFIDKGLYCTKKYVSLRQKALKNADLLLPNSTEEMNLCALDFNLDMEYIKKKTVVVPNATDFSVDANYSNDTSELQLPKKYVVIAGRIDSTKNQLNVIKALYKNKEIGVVIVGRVQNEKTYNKIKKLAEKSKNVYFISQLPQNELVQIYKNAICHVLPSFYDTTGLVNLEALLCGCPIVVSNSKHCPVKYYEFDKYGEICNPYKPKSIKKAIYRIINKKKQNVNSDYIYKISYDNVANITYKAYKQLLGSVT